MDKHELGEHQEVFDYTSEVSKLEAGFAKELTAEIAHDYIASLVEKLDSANGDFAKFVEKGKELHYGIGKEIYGPLIVGYCQWLKDQAGILGHAGKVFFALRDAAPLLTAAQILWKDDKLKPVGTYVNRPLLGIEDEIAPEISMQNGKIADYLVNNGIIDGEVVLWADTGAWGTVIKTLKEDLLKECPIYPYFWYSHNPHIPGYLNGLMQSASIGEKYGEILNDSMECVFPQQFLRPLLITPDTSDVILLPNNYLSVVWGQAALDGVSAAATLLGTGLSLDDQTSELKKLAALSQQAKESCVWTGVLPTNTPTWSHGQEFLTSFGINLIGKGNEV